MVKHSAYLLVALYVFLTLCLFKKKSKFWLISNHDYIGLNLGTMTNVVVTTVTMVREANSTFLVISLF